jgi:D-methionine transport system substrate-binding protein
MIKKAGLTLAVLGALVTSFGAQALEPLRVAADPVPHAQILAYIQKIDPQLNLKVIEIPNGVNSNELLVHGDVDANYFQHLPYLKSQEKALGEKLAWPPRCISNPWAFTRTGTKASLMYR